MKRRLVIIRHAKADRENPWPNDFSRILTERGIADAKKVGEKLLELSIMPDHVLSSPAVRAISTASLVCGALGFEAKKIVTESSIYEATLNDLIKVLQGVNDKHRTVFLFGHNPSFTNLVNRMQDVPMLNLPTCGTVSIVMETGYWKETGKKVGKREFSIIPKELK